MPKITVKEVKKLGLLSRVSISEKEASELQKDMEKILNFVSKLEKAEISDTICSTLNVEHVNIFRGDEAGEKPARDRSLLKQAPEMERGYIKTKKVL